MEEKEIVTVSIDGPGRVLEALTMRNEFEGTTKSTTSRKKKTKQEKEKEWQNKSLAAKLGYTKISQT